MKTIQKTSTNDGGTGAPRTFLPQPTNANARRSARSTIRKIAIAALALVLALMPATETRATDASLDVGDWAVDSTSRTIQSVLNNSVSIGTFTFNGGAGSLALTVNASGSAWSIAKRYVLPMRNNLYGGSTVNTWLKVLPSYDTGSNGGGLNNFDVDVNVSGTAMQVRLRISAASAVSTAVTANIVIESTGVGTVAYPVNPNASSIVGPPTAAQLFSGSVITQVNGQVGVNTAPSVDAALDINGGDTTGFRLRPRSVTGSPATGTWTTGTLIVDSAGALYLCTASGTPGTWKKVTP